MRVDSISIMEDIIYHMKEEDIRFKNIVLCQMIEESGWFKSKNCIKRNNFLNMKVPYRRYFFGSNHGDFGNYAYYENIQSFIRDLKSWQMSNTYLCKTEEQYLSTLSSTGFAENSRYIKNILSIRVKILANQQIQEKLINKKSKNK
jgi:hypothetical protein